MAKMRYLVLNHLVTGNHFIYPDIKVFVLTWIFHESGRVTRQRSGTATYRLFNRLEPGTNDH
jgi:hypothetical protein